MPATAVTPWLEVGAPINLKPTERDASMNNSAMRRAVLAGAVTLTVLILAACGGKSGDGGMGGMDHGGSVATASPKTGGTVNDADIQFAQMMIPHHQQAVEMAALAETQAKDGEVKQLA